nr:MAG TPA: hypothetical protein [Caudoviricetes sp.]
MSNINDIKLDELTSVELAELAGRVADAHTKATAREAEALLTARQQLTDAAAQLRKHLGPPNPRSGNLSSLREACKLPPKDLTGKAPEVLQLLLTSLRDVTAVAEQVVLIGAAQAR